MRSDGLVFGSRDFVGSVSPPAAGPLEDISPFGNDGVFTNAPTWVQNASGLWVLSYNGSSNLVTVPSDVSLDRGLSITVAAWVKTSVALQQAVAHKWAAAGGWLAQIFADQTLGWSFGVGDDHSSVGKITLGSWNHVAWTYDNTNLIYYINGVGETETTAVNGKGAVTNSQDLELGVFMGTRYLNGSLATIRILSRALDATEIADRFQEEKPYFE